MHPTPANLTVETLRPRQHNSTLEPSEIKNPAERTNSHAKRPLTHAHTEPRCAVRLHESGPNPHRWNNSRQLALREEPGVCDLNLSERRRTHQEDLVPVTKRRVLFLRLIVSVKSGQDVTSELSRAGHKAPSDMVENKQETDRTSLLQNDTP